MCFSTDSKVEETVASTPPAIKVRGGGDYDYEYDYEAKSTVSGNFSFW